MKIDITPALDAPFVQIPVDVKITRWEVPVSWEFLGSVDVKGTLSFDEKELAIVGTVAGTLSVPCSRCLVETQYPFEYTFDNVYAESPDEGGEMYPILEKQIVLDQMVLDEISLNLPVQYLCKETCRGLCPVCGENRNLAPCDCEREAQLEKSPFGQLKGLFDDEEV